MGEWQHGLFGCFDNFVVCAITYFVPCVTAGKNAEAVGEDCLMHGIYSLVPILQCIMHNKIRGMIREKQGIPSEGSDAMVCLKYIICCSACALCQEAQEVNAYGTMAEDGETIERQ